MWRIFNKIPGFIFIKLIHFAGSGTATSPKPNSSAMLCCVGIALPVWSGLVKLEIPLIAFKFFLQSIYSVWRTNQISAPGNFDFNQCLWKHHTICRALQIYKFLLHFQVQSNQMYGFYPVFHVPAYCIIKLQNRPLHLLLLFLNGSTYPYFIMP